MPLVSFNKCCWLKVLNYMWMENSSAFFIVHFFVGVLVYRLTEKRDIKTSDLLLTSQCFYCLMIFMCLFCRVKSLYTLFWQVSLNVACVAYQIANQSVLLYDIFTSSFQRNSPHSLFGKFQKNIPTQSILMLSLLSPVPQLSWHQHSAQTCSLFEEHRNT